MEVAAPDGVGFFLWWGLSVAALGLICATVFPLHRRLALLSGLWSAHFGLLEPIFVPEYWNPPHLFGSWLSIEAVAFAFGSGVLTWLAAAVPFGSRITCNIGISWLWRRLVLTDLILIAGIAVSWRRAFGFIPLPIGDADLLAIAIVGAFFLVRRPDAWPFAVTGCLGFSLIYALQLAILTTLVPGVGLIWSTNAGMGPFLFGLPFEEMMWAVLFGAIAPMGIAYGNEVRLSSVHAIEVVDRGTAVFHRIALSLNPSRDAVRARFKRDS